MPSINYSAKVNEAMRNVIRDVLSHVCANGLDEENHFYITFDTTQAGVSIPDFLKTKYPEKMTIVLQHQFKKLKVREKEFSVFLSFSSTLELIVVPFRSIVKFSDPSANFSIHFDSDGSIGEVISYQQDWASDQDDYSFDGCICHDFECSNGESALSDDEDVDSEKVVDINEYLKGKIMF